MDGGQSPVRPEWPLFGDIGVHGRRLTSITRPRDADQITLGLGRVAFYCICRVPTASRGVSKRMEVGADTARDLPPNKGGDGSTGEPTHQRTRDRDGQSGRDGLIASSRLIALVGGSGRHEPPFGIDEPHPGVAPSSPLPPFLALPCTYPRRTGR